MSLYSEHPYGEKVENTYAKGLNNGFEAGQSSNARLDKSNLECLIKYLGLGSAAILSRDLRIHDFAEVTYIFSLMTDAYDGPPFFEIRIIRMKDAPTAAQMMKESLRSYSTDISQILHCSPKPYGSCSLQSPGDVFWTHGEIFLHIHAMRHRSYQIGSRTPYTATTSDVGARILNEVALSLNQYLTLDSIPASEVPKPRPTLKTLLPLKVTRGKIFKIEIENHADTDDQKAVQFDPVGKVIHNPAESSGGVVKFFAKETGPCKVSIIVAHRLYLTLGRVEVDVEVEEMPA